MALDRPEMQYAVKEAARCMANPRQRDEAALRRIARYLKQRPRLVWKFDWQELPKQLIVECDSDFAGCLRTRKSTSGYASFLGKHCVAARSKTQLVIATSSGEAELYALGSAVSNGLG